MPRMLSGERLALLEWIVAQLQPADLWTSNWLGAGRFEVTHRTPDWWHVSCDISHVICHPYAHVYLRRLPTVSVSSGWNGADWQFEVDLAEPDGLERLRAGLDPGRLLERLLTDGRLRTGPAAGFKPVRWREEIEWRE